VVGWLIKNWVGVLTGGAIIQEGVTMQSSLHTETSWAGYALLLYMPRSLANKNVILQPDPETSAQKLIK
jgi:hypothetical protein